MDMLRKVISGGQTGVDRAALQAAKATGLETGGWMPKGFLAHDGTRPDFAGLFGLREHPSSDKYPPRTELNVRNSDATLRLAARFDTRGEQCTMKMIRKHRKPTLDVDVLNPPPPEDVAQWILDHRCQTLNVAGNSEKAWPGIEQIAEVYLRAVFVLLT